ncbi:MAG: metallophosphoesterase, partial [Minisyncoccota bacterium]
YFQSIINKIKEIKPDIVFITGDLFDGMDGHLEELVAPIDQLDPALGIYFVTGNHETYLGIDNAFAALSKTKVKILDDAFIDIDGMQITGLSFPNRGVSEGRDFATAFKSLVGLDRSRPIILLYHSPMQIIQAKDLGVDLFLAGHTHVGQLFPLGLITSIVYKGFDYGLYEDGNFSVYVSSGVGTWGPTVRTSKNSEIVLINFQTK